jgi:predicted GTPase
MKRIVIMGAGGRDFHDFNMAFRHDPDHEVVAFTAAQIPYIADRRYPASLAGDQYPDGIPIVAEAALAELIRTESVDEVVFAYSDVPHEQVMHRASLALAAGAGFRLLGPKATTLTSVVPVVAVCATRTGAGKSPTSRRVGRLLLDAGLRVGLVRHPMPYGDLERMRAQRFTSRADIDAARPTIEEREEFELPVEMGMVVYAGVDYAMILRGAERECDVLVWDGGNNDVPFIRPDLHITVTDALRPGHEVGYHPGEVNLRRADVVVLNKVGSSDDRAVARVLANLRRVNPTALLVRADSPVTLDDGPSLRGAKVLVVEDGPSVTHGGMPVGAGTVAARRSGAELIDPRPAAVGSLARVYRDHPHLGPVLPAMGYSPDQVEELRITIDAVDCDAVITGTPMDLARVVHTRHPIRRAHYELRELGSPTLAEVLGPHVGRWKRSGPVGPHV